MYDEQADVLVAKNLKKIEALDSAFSILTNQMTIEYEPSASGMTDLRESSMSLGTQHQHIAKSTGISETILISFVFYHEMGHQILPWTRVPKEQRTQLMNDYFSQDKDLRGSPEYFLEVNNIELFNNSKLRQLYNSLSEGFENHSNETNILLSKFSQKIEAIYHEQFADNFSLFMLKKQFPKEFDRFAKFLVEGRKNDENFYRDYHDNSMDSSSSLGFVHCLHNITQEYLTTSSEVNSFTEFQKMVFPLMDKHTASEIKVAMDSQKLGVYFPEDLNPQPKSSVQDKIKSIRQNSISNTSLALKNKL